MCMRWYVLYGHGIYSWDMVHALQTRYTHLEHGICCIATTYVLVAWNMVSGYIEHNICHMDMVSGSMWDIRGTIGNFLLIDSTRLLLGFCLLNVLLMCFLDAFRNSKSKTTSKRSQHGESKWEPKMDFRATCRK